MKRKIRIISALLLIAMLVVTAAQAAPLSVKTLTVTESEQGASDALIASMLEAVLKDTDSLEYPEPDADELVRVIVLLEDAPLVEKGITDPTAANARKGMVSIETEQSLLVKRIEKEVFDGSRLDVIYRYSFLLNGFSMYVPYGSIEDIAAVEGIKSVTVSPVLTMDESAFEITEDSDAALLADNPRENPTEYRGEHTVVAILDTGMEFTHPVFSDGAPNPLYSKSDIANKISTLNLNAKAVSGFSADTAYYNSKIPFSFDYADMDTNATCPSTNPHGLHVAGIVAGNDNVPGMDSRMNSAAPDAQIMMMKVFDANRNSSPDIIAAALEDATLLGVDSVNISIGFTDSFSSLDSLAPLGEACRNAMAAGVNVIGSAGNEYNSSRQNILGGKTYTTNPDNSISNAPGTFLGVLCVAADNGISNTAVASFSSQGPNSDLVLSPEISAFGSMVYSSWARGTYTSMSGTSMAAPYIAGAAAAMRQYIRENIDLDKLPTPVTLEELAKGLLVSTAVPNTTITSVSPRRQGAGHMNMEGATTTPAYITIGTSTRPIIDQKDDPEKTGVFDLEFRVNNMTSSELSYTVEVNTVTENIMQYVGPDNTLTPYMAGFAKQLAPTVTVEGAENNALTVKGSGYSDVKVTLNLSKDDRTFLDTNYTNGGYVEGHIRLIPTGDGVALTVPFLCFYGDWTKAPIIDVYNYYDEINGEVNRSSTMTNLIYTSHGGNPFYLGDNPLHPGKVTYILDRNAISPNGDGYLDRVETVRVALLRNARRAGYRIWDDNQVYWRKERDFVPKSRTQDNGSVLYLGNRCSFVPWNGAGLSNNATVNLTTYAEVDFTLHEINNLNSEWTVPVTIDTEEPKLLTAKLRTEGNKSYLDLTVRDNQFIADITISDTEYIKAIGSYAIAETERGVEKTYSYDVTGQGANFGVTLTDYAMNTASFRVTNGSYENPNTPDVSPTPDVTPDPVVSPTPDVTPDPDKTPDPDVSDPPTTTESPQYLPGDANLDGLITAGDATMILRHIVGIQYLTGINFEVADISGDGILTAGDATMVLRVVVGAN